MGRSHRLTPGSVAEATLAVLPYDAYGKTESATTIECNALVANSDRHHSASIASQKWPQCGLAASSSTDDQLLLLSDPGRGGPAVLSHL